MYRKEDAHQLKFENFYLPFGGKLRRDNRWVILAGRIPWQSIEQTYGQQFCQDHGAAAKPARMALGALIIKERLGVTDRETVDQICENPYLQYFLGLSEYTDKEPFHHSMMTHFRKTHFRRQPEPAHSIEKIVKRLFQQALDNFA